MRMVPSWAIALLVTSGHPFDAAFVIYLVPQLTLLDCQISECQIKSIANDIMGLILPGVTVEEMPLMTTC